MDATFKVRYLQPLIQMILVSNGLEWNLMLKFMFSKKATKIDEIFNVDLTVNAYCQIDNEDFVNFCGLLKKRELYPRFPARQARKKLNVAKSS